jgi:phosphoglycolate phosphatase-like HAD superfamily hydrolase
MKVCLFDIDGTLLASGGAGKAAMEAALTTVFGTPASSSAVPFSGRTDRAIVRDLFALHNIPYVQANWQSFLAAYLGHLPQYLHSHNGRVLPGIADLLEALRQRGDVAVGLLTGNVRDGAKLKLGHYGLYHHFAFGAFGDEYFERDEVAREALAAVRKHLTCQVACEDIWVIGDTPLDVQCARSIGAKAVAVATGWHSLDLLAAAKPDLVLKDLADATPFWELWASI